MEKMSPLFKVLFILTAALLVFGACSTSEDTAVVNFSLTDAPDTGDLTHVMITVSEIKVNESSSAGEEGSGWRTLALVPPVEYDLLTLTNGVVAGMGELEIAGGSQINQIRFKIDKAQVSSDDGTTFTNLTVPSGSVRIVNSFQVPLSGEIGITLDFDVRKSLVLTGAGVYILKPAIRAIVDNEAGWITGTAPAGAFVYLYADGDYEEGVEPTASTTTAGVESPAFPNAYTSTVANAEGNFKLSFLDPGTYDIVVQLADGSDVKLFNLDLVVAADSPTAAGELVF
jgi:hypothetical protein